ncbi:MAG: hypothetical protein ACD_40C00124G0003 [uncultured bacterium]|nr:MAG: hypothetical protein ACD_40C00124G0003 [uncultured bacterium]
MGEVDKRAQPIGIDKTRVAGNKESAVIGIVNFNIAPINLDGFGGNNVFDIGGALGKNGDGRRDGWTRAGWLGGFATKKRRQVQFWHIELV